VVYYVDTTPCPPPTRKAAKVGRKRYSLAKERRSRKLSREITKKVRSPDERRRGNYLINDTAVYKDKPFSIESHEFQFHIKGLREVMTPHE
jgi:hypothetical protein